MTAKREIALFTVGCLALVFSLGIAGANSWCNLEYWAQRYQTIIAAMIALAAASPVFAQLSEMRRQTAAIAKSSLVESVKLLEIEIASIDDAVFDSSYKEFIGLVRTCLNNNCPYSQFDLAYKAARNRARLSQEPVNAQIIRRWKKDDIWQARSNFLDCLTDFVGAMEITRGRYEYFVLNNQKEYFADQYSVDILDKRFSYYMHASNVLRETLVFETKIYWRDIRRLEDQALSRLAH